jgi:arsenate reductase
VNSPFNVLFLCTGNSARSIMGEAILNHKGNPEIVAYSAGSHPSGRVRPETLKELEGAGISTDGLRSKSWEEFSKPGAPEMHLVITVCDDAASEPCPLWPGRPQKLHWGLPDPAAAQGSEAEKERAFHTVFLTLDQKIEALLASPQGGCLPRGNK